MIDIAFCVDMFINVITHLDQSFSNVYGPDQAVS